jgi:mannose-6-phosphate isomerase-like protein (cupin superfamily)
MKHEDNRRIIYDWAQGNFKSLKAVFVKEEIAIGDHYHKNKDEVFFLAQGKLIELTLGANTAFDIEAPYVIHVPAGLYHKFICEPGSIIFGGATELFDPKDEIK